jgi:O-antigen/teichoic acid export membrane protein
MGPETFGRYALIWSVSVWLSLVSGFSSAQTMSRFVPEFSVSGRRDELDRFVNNLLALRLLSGTLVAALYFVVTAALFPELELAAIAMAALAVCVRSVAKLLFALFLGLNQAARWGFGEVLGRWASLLFIIPGAYFGGLVGACLAVLVAEFLVLLLGVVWARSYVSWRKVRLDRQYLRPYVRFGAGFYASNVLFSVSQQCGELLVRLVSGDYLQVGYFSVAYRIYMIAALTVWQVTMAFGPLLTTLRSRADTAEIRHWVELLLKSMAIGGVIVVATALLVGDEIVPLALGEAYRPVAAHLVPLTMALLTYALGCLARLLALNLDQPDVATRAALINLAGFLGFGVPFVAWGGSLAGCYAVLASSALYAAYFTWRMRRLVRYSLWNWSGAILGGVLVLPLLALRSSPGVNVALLLIFVGSYACLLFVLRIVTPADLARVRQSFRHPLAIED